MRLLYVVQRYGEEVAGGAEQHARAFAERLVERDHRVTVLTTCAESYVDWANAYRRGWSNLNGVAVFRTPVTKARNPHLFSAFNSRISNTSGVRPLSVQREWMRMQGPFAPALVPWLRHHASSYDAVVFITYLYWTTWAGLRVCGGAVPTLLHPTAHDEPPMRLSIFQEVMRAPDAFVFLTPEEADLVRARFPEARGLIEVHFLVAVPGGRKERAERLQGRRHEANLLLALARRGRLRLLVRLQRARGQLPGRPADRVAILAHEDDRSRVRDRDQDDRARVSHDLDLHLAALARGDRFDGHREHAALEHLADLVGHNRLVHLTPLPDRAIRAATRLWPHPHELRRRGLRRPRLQHHAVPPRRSPGNRAGDAGCAASGGGVAEPRCACVPG